MKKREIVIQRILELRQDTRKLRELKHPRLVNNRPDPVTACTYCNDSFEDLLRILENHLITNFQMRVQVALSGIKCNYSRRRE